MLHYKYHSTIKWKCSLNIILELHFHLYDFLDFNFNDHRHKIHLLFSWLKIFMD